MRLIESVAGVVKARQFARPRAPAALKMLHAISAVSRARARAACRSLNYVKPGCSLVGHEVVPAQAWNITEHEAEPVGGEGRPFRGSKRAAWGELKLFAHIYHSVACTGPAGALMSNSSMPAINSGCPEFRDFRAFFRLRCSFSAISSLYRSIINSGSV